MTSKCRPRRRGSWRLSPSHFAIAEVAGLDHGRVVGAPGGQLDRAAALRLQEDGADPEPVLGDDARGFLLGVVDDGREHQLEVGRGQVGVGAQEPVALGDV